MLVVQLWRQQPGQYFCISTKDPDSGRWKDHFFSRDDLDQVPRFVREHRDQNLYFCPHGFSKPKRRKEYAVMPKVLWADLDEADPRKVPIEPTVAWESSPGRYAALWFTDKPVTEDLNRDLAYHIGSDKSGWDLTQVLRIPMTINYKYPEEPKGRLLWDDGEQYRRDVLARRVPHVNGHVVMNGHDHTNLYKKYEKKLSPGTRREILYGKPRQGKRSDMLWKIENELFEAGATLEEVIEIVKQSSWNKFAGRRDEDRQLKREAEKILAGRLERKEERNGPARRWFARSLADIKEEEPDFIYYPFLVRRMITIVEGDPGLGKSYLLQMWSQAITDGERLPQQRAGDPVVQGPVVFISMEDDPACVIKVRTRMAGMKNEHLFYPMEHAFSVDDEEALEEMLNELREIKPELVVIDPINPYLGLTDTGNAAQVSQAMVPFVEWAKELNCAVCLVRHLTKGNKEKALYRGQGSIAFTGTARIVASVGVHPDDPGARVVVVNKTNLAAKGRAVAFKVIALPDTLKERGRAKFEWMGLCDFTADEILAAKEERKGDDKEKGAIEFLKKVLDDGPVELSKVENMANKRNIPPRTLRKAMELMDVRQRSKGFGRRKLVTVELKE